MDAHTMRVVSELRGHVRRHWVLATAVQRMPVPSAIGAFENTAGREPDVEVLGVARVDVDGMEHRSVRCVLFWPLRPSCPHRMVVPTVVGIPGVTAVSGHEEALGRTSRVPDVGLRRMPGSEPEHRRETALEGLASAKGRGATGFGPRRPQVVGAKHGRPEVAGAEPGQHAPPVAGIEDDVLRDVAEEHRLARGPVGSGPITRQDEGSLAGTDE